MTSLPVVREYDQVLTGNIKIKKISHGDSDHMITFSKKKISTIFIYQVLSRSNTLNQNREFNELKATEWVKRAFSNPYYTPTTVMKLQYGECPFHHKNDKKDHYDKYTVCRHVFVINRAKVNKCGQVVFYISSDVMTLPPKPNKYLKSLKLAKKIPTTKCNEEFHNVQFTIDDGGGTLGTLQSVTVNSTSYSGQIPSNLNGFTNGLSLSFYYNPNNYIGEYGSTLTIQVTRMIFNNVDLTKLYYIVVLDETGGGEGNPNDLKIYFYNNQNDYTDNDPPVLKLYCLINL
jgi:hypothetical protein